MQRERETHRAKTHPQQKEKSFERCKEMITHPEHTEGRFVLSILLSSTRLADLRLALNG
jgi:hypothetical protein